jgi:hypothetical protein
MGSKQINIFGKIARIINRGNSIVVDSNGVEENVESFIKAAWYLGTNGNYQKRITAPWLVDPLLKVAAGSRMRLYTMESHGKHYLVCVLGRGAYSGMGYCRLDIAGLTHDQNKAMEFVVAAAGMARANYDAALAIMVTGRHYPMAVEWPRDVLVPLAA